MKKFVSAFLALLLICCMISSALAADQSTKAADVLYELGLFKGTGTNPDGTPIYDLGQTEDVAYFVPFYLKDFVAKMPKKLL